MTDQLPINPYHQEDIASGMRFVELRDAKGNLINPIDPTHGSGQVGGAGGLLKRQNLKDYLNKRGDK